MREIKCRGKRPNSGKWITGGLVRKGAFAYILGNGHFEVECSTEVLHETVGEYTGIKDKNGVEIYEGDIVTSELTLGNSPNPWAVEWDTERARFYVQPKDTSSRIVEVIGNVYDNADLLRS